ncbi:MAG: serine/threonine protein kinase [Bryobacterales bacterium]|nr:serine/threonine protein kinase [Bryobacterales bacterium]
MTIMGQGRAAGLAVGEKPLNQRALRGEDSSVGSELLARGRRRLGWMALAIAVAIVLLHVSYRTLFPTDLVNAPPIAADTLMGSLIVFFTFSLALWRLCWSKTGSNSLVFHLGLAYHVAGAWVVTLLGTSPKLGQTEVGAFGYADAWIVVVALMLPVRPWKIAVSCGLCTLALPFVVRLNEALWNVSAPPREVLIMNVLSTVVTSGIVVFLSALSYDMRVQLTEAKRLGAYQLLRRIGQGGMGEVWVARHSLLARATAVKIVSAEHLASGTKGNDAPMMRFEREARATAGLRSPHTVTVFDFGSTGDGQLYYAMEYLEGLDLREIVKRFGPLPGGRAIYLLLQACDSLREAHRKGIIHRDIKPSNLFLCRLGDNYDFLKILDFGLARDLTATGASVQLTQEGSTAGTPAFMAPEIALGTSRAEATSDLYSLGCVAYWLLTGADVFEAKSPMQVMFAHAKEKPTPPSKRSELPISPDLERIVLWCLEKEPEDRPQTAGELMRALAGLEPQPSWTNENAESWWKLHLPDVKSSDAILAAELEPTIKFVRPYEQDRLL